MLTDCAARLRESFIITFDVVEFAMALATEIDEPVGATLGALFALLLMLLIIIGDDSRDFIVTPGFTVLLNCIEVDDCCCTIGLGRFLACTSTFGGRFVLRGVVDVTVAGEVAEIGVAFKMRALGIFGFTGVIVIGDDDLLLLIWFIGDFVRAIGTIDDALFVLDLASASLLRPGVIVAVFVAVALVRGLYELAAVGALVLGMGLTVILLFIFGICTIIFGFAVRFGVTVNDLFCARAFTTDSELGKALAGTAADDELAYCAFRIIDGIGCVDVLLDTLTLVVLTGKWEKHLENLFGFTRESV